MDLSNTTAKMAPRGATTLALLFTPLIMTQQETLFIIIKTTTEKADANGSSQLRLHLTRVGISLSIITFSTSIVPRHP